MLKKFICFYTIAILCLLYFLMEADSFRILTLYAILVVSLIQFRFSLTYPYVWLSPFLVLYNTSFYILDILGIRSATHVGIILNMTLLSLIIFYIFSICFIREQRISFRFSVNSFNLRSCKHVWTFFCVLLSIYIPLFFMGG